MNLPRPSCNSWGKWLDVLTPAQLRAVHAWRREGYNALLGPQTCWYLLCGRHDEAEKARRRALSDDYTEKKAAQDAAIAARKQAGKSYGAKTKADYRAKQAVSGGSAVILGGSDPDMVFADVRQTSEAQRGLATEAQLLEGEAA